MSLLQTSCTDQVLLQTYIEYLRGLVEEKTSINHHGNDVEVEPDQERPISSTGEKNHVLVLP